MASTARTAIHKGSDARRGSSPPSICRRLWRPRSLLLLLAMALLPAAAQSATITVTTTADDLTPSDGTVSLREAITAINTGSSLGDPDIVAQAPGAYGSNDTIVFNIAGACPRTIAPGSALPTIVKTVAINGYTQTGAAVNTLATGDNATLCVILDGTGAGLSTDALTLSNHSGSTISGLVVANFGGNGIAITGTGGGHSITGNFIGINAAGTTAAANGADGVKIVGVANNTIGSTAPAMRNIISGNGPSNVFAGVDIESSGATGNVVAGNYIGVDRNGTTAVGNSTTFGYGVVVFNSANSNAIGGSAAGAGNVISGNGGGVSIQAASNNAVLGNLIGTNATGTAALSNKFDGVSVSGTAAGNAIGGTSAGARNVVSGNTTSGITLGGCLTTTTLVQGNFIGTDVSGTNPLGNGASGVSITGDHHDSTVGGTTVGSGNLIAFNVGSGVVVKPPGSCSTPAVNDAILGNSIHDNGALGIDLGNDGVTPNTPGGPHAGVNHLQNFPVLTTVQTGVGGTTATGSLNSSASATFRVEFFANTACDASGNGEGRTFLGFSSVTTDVAGNVALNAVLPSVPVGQFVTATANDPNNNTSEFSACVQVTAAPAAAAIPTPTLNGVGLALLAFVLAGLAGLGLRRR